MPHVRGTPPDEGLQFPQNPVRFIEAFGDSLDLKSLGFTRATAAHTGRPSHHPGDLLKRYLSSHLNRIRCSRPPEKECGDRRGRIVESNKERPNT
jgi:hypothetical protein